MKKNILILLLASFALCGCDNNNEQEQGQTKPELTGEYTKEILTSGEVFTEKFPSSGYQFNSEENIEDLRGYFDSQIEYENLVTSIQVSSLQSRNGYDTNYLQVGSASLAGSLKWNSDVFIYKVAVKACCYSKYDLYNQVTNTDSTAHVKINDSDYDLEGSVEPTFKTFEKEFNEGVNSFTISSLANSSRFFVKSITITWRG